MAEQVANSSTLVHDFDKKEAIVSPKFIGLLIGVVLLGIVTGYIISRHTSATVNTTISSTSTSAQIKKGDVLGTNDTSTFKDTVEGKLASGGIDGEGQYHLVRPGGDSQNVYMTSSTVDLSKLVGRQIKVWGATQTAQHAGWLMDVGKVEVEN